MLLVLHSQLTNGLLSHSETLVQVLSLLEEILHLHLKLYLHQVVTFLPQSTCIGKVTTQSCILFKLFVLINQLCHFLMHHLHDLFVLIDDGVCRGFTAWLVAVEDRLW
jgi:hypothetical protein